MTADNQTLEKRISELEKLLQEAEAAAEYYKKRAEDNGTKRLREIDQLSTLIAERKRAEQALRSSKEKFFSLFNLSPQAIAVTELTSGKLVDVNNAFCELTRLRPERILGKTTTQLGFYSQEKRDRFLWALRSAGEVQGLEMTFKLDNTATIYALMFSKLIQIDGKSLVITVFHDLTERKAAEEALRKSEERFRQLADLLPQTVFETDEKGNLTYANRVAFHMFGYSQEDFATGLNVYQMLIPEDRGQARERIRRIMSGETYVGAEYTALRKDGSRYPAYIYSSPIINDGVIRGIRGIVADISEVKRAQEALRESEDKIAKLKKMEALGLLAGGVAHDLNNVLSGIVSYPDLMLMDLPDNSRLRKPIETMKQSGQKATAIVQDLLTVARGVATFKEPLNINDIVKAYLNSPEFKKLNYFHPLVSVKTDLSPHLLNINASHVHIGKALMNLVSNAAEAIEDRGNVTISSMNRYLDRPLKAYVDVNRGGYAMLSVSDDGPGIPPYDLERIFDPFYTKKVMGRSGTGLGLSVVWNVVQDHGGYIDVISDENGTVFELYFPITQHKSTDKDVSLPIQELKGKGETILVIDDVESQRDISCQMLNALNYQTTVVSDGDEAVAYLKGHAVDLILLDMIMDPGKNGCETYKEIIKMHPNQKAIIVSGFAETDEVRETQKLGAGRFVKKPFSMEEIGLAVKKELT